MKLEQCWFELNIQWIADYNNRCVKADRQRKIKDFFVGNNPFNLWSRNICQPELMSHCLSPLLFYWPRVPGICQESFNQWRSSNRNLFYDGNNTLETRNQTKFLSQTNICVIFVQTRAQARKICMYILLSLFDGRDIIQNSILSLFSVWTAWASSNLLKSKINVSYPWKEICSAIHHNLI